MGHRAISQPFFARPCSYPGAAVYAHHVQGPVALFGSEGAEMRFSFKAEPLPQPYRHVIDAQALAGSPE